MAASQGKVTSCYQITEHAAETRIGRMQGTLLISAHQVITLLDRLDNANHAISFRGRKQDVYDLLMTNARDFDAQ